MMTHPKPVAALHALLKSPLSGVDIENLSFRIIDAEMQNHTFTQDQWLVVRRMIHATADFSLADDVYFNHDAIRAAIAALHRGAPIYADSNMIRAGLSTARLTGVSTAYADPRIMCHIGDPDVATLAINTGLPRSLYAVRKAREHLNNAIILIGNAPVALLEVNRMVMEEGLLPALVIGMPVGFVHVVESKEELLGLDIPSIMLRGRRGGSALAVSVLHALAALATDDRGVCQNHG